MAIWWALILGMSGTASDADAQTLALMLQARYALISEDHERAMELAQNALATAPDNPDAAFLRIEVMLDLHQSLVFPPSQLKRLPKRQQQRELLLDLERLVRKFPHDYRFAKTLGTLLVSNPGFELPRVSQPDHYLHQAAALLKRNEEVHKKELSDTYYYLGRWYLVNERFFEASGAFAKVCDLEPESTWAWYYAGQTCEASHQLRKALRYYETFRELGTRELWRGGPPVNLDIATLKLQLWPEGSHLEEVLKLLGRKEDATSHYRVAARLAQSALYPPCLEVLEAIPESKRDATYHGLWLKSQMELHRYDLVWQRIQQILGDQGEGQIQAVLVDYGLEAAILLGHFQQVLRYTKTYRTTPGLTLKLDLFGAFAAALDQGNEDPWHQVQAKHGDSEFVRLLAAEVQSLGMDLVAIKYLVQLYLGRSDWQGAMRWLRTLQQGEGLPDALKEDLALTHILAEQPQEAFRLYDDLLQKMPDRKDLKNNYGYFLANTGTNLERAKTLIEEALAQDSRNSAYLDSMGWVLFKLGRFEEAERYLRLALESDPNDSEKLDHLGEVLHALGKETEARETWSLAMEHAGANYFQILDKLDPEPR